MPDYNKNKLHIYFQIKTRLLQQTVLGIQTVTSNFYQNDFLNQELNQGYQNGSQNNFN